MKKAFYLLYKLWVAFVFWATLILLYPIFRVLIVREKWHPTVFRLKRFWSNWIRWLLLCPIRLDYKTELPKPPYVICSNHCSYLDTVFMFSLFPDYFLFVGKGELLKWPLFSLFFRHMDIPVQRENFKQAHGALSKAYTALEKGHCIAIYPEGTIPYSAPKMGPFKNGAFKMATACEVPIVPVTWQSNNIIMNDIENLWSPARPAVVRAIIHEPIYPKDKTRHGVNSLREEVFDVIESGLIKNQGHQYNEKS